MDKLHPQTLKAAVKKYFPLTQESKSEAEIKEAIAADEKGFTEENVNEIFEAIINYNPSSEPPLKTKKKYVVIKPFRDIDNFNLEHEEGKNVSHFKKDRLAHLLKNGHVEEQDDE